MVMEAIDMQNGNTHFQDRERLAGALREIVDDAGRRGIHISRAPLARRRVAEAATELRLLATRLQAPGPVDPRGLADVSRLLSDGCGPLYNRRSPQSLSSAATAARLALGPAE
jgi:hypothetical protein